MNDAHDNAADDRAMWRRARTQTAIEAFRKQELKRLQLEMAEYALEKELNGRLDMDEYVRVTEQIRNQMELKRVDYERLGKLPKTIGKVTDDMVAKPAAQLPATDHCPTCGKVHKAPEVVGVHGIRFWPYHEYIIHTLIGTQRKPRIWRMGYIGFGNGMEWSARGPDRTHGNQYGGTQRLDLRDIVYAEEVQRDDRLRHVGMTQDELDRLRRTMSATLPARS